MLLNVILGTARVGAQNISTQPTVYYANHSSHSDFIYIMSSLPDAIKPITRPVAAADYWDSGLKKWISKGLFNAIMVNRQGDKNGNKSDPLAPLSEAIQQGDSLIIFPEGTRNNTEHDLLPFKTGIYHLATRHPKLNFVPIWLDNAKRILPKGAVLPVPLNCTVFYGEPFVWDEQMPKDEFLTMAHQRLLQLKPQKN